MCASKKALTIEHAIEFPNFATAGSGSDPRPGQLSKHYSPPRTVSNRGRAGEPPSDLGKRGWPWKVAIVLEACCPPPHHMWLAPGGVALLPGWMRATAKGDVRPETVRASPPPGPGQRSPSRPAEGAHAPPASLPCGEQTHAPRASPSPGRSRPTPRVAGDHRSPAVPRAGQMRPMGAQTRDAPAEWPGRPRGVAH